MRSWGFTVAGVVLGAVAGWFYWRHWGCTNGCAITGSPVNSTLYGAVMGALVINLFRKDNAAEQARGKGNPHG